MYDACVYYVYHVAQYEDSRLFARLQNDALAVVTFCGVCLLYMYVSDGYLVLTSSIRPPVPVCICVYAYVSYVCISP